MNGTDMLNAASQRMSDNVRAACVTTADAEFDRWLMARTFFKPPASQLPEQLQQELRGQFLADRAWYERPRCSHCNQFLERRAANRRQVLIEEGVLGRRFSRDRRQH